MMSGTIDTSLKKVRLVAVPVTFNFCACAA